MPKKIWVFQLVFTLFFTLLALPEKLFAVGTSKADTISQLQLWYDQTKADPVAPVREKDLKLDFIQRLIFQTNNKYPQESIVDQRLFFRTVIWDLYQTDNLKSNKSYSRYNLFLALLTKALGDVIEPRESVVDFMKNFSQFMGLQKPQALADFVSKRNYFDGKQMLQAEPLDSESASDIADLRLKAHDFELPERLKIKVDFTLELPPPQVSECCKTPEIQTLTVPDHNLNL